jgi:hypothetical protein
VLPRASFDDILRDEQQPLEHSVIQYFLMGDLRDPEAPGNQWVHATRWPPESRPTPLYLQPEQGLAESIPPEGKVSYTYDPNDPAPHFGGHYSWRGDRSGPHDQRPLRKREDVLYFETEPLEQPLNVTGRLRARLYVSSTAEDTLFIVKLVDIYPDGYEAILREGAAMARYANGFDDPQPLEAGRVYALDVDLWSTAQVFNRGHKIALIVTSSAAGAEQHPFEIHPNTYDPIRVEDMPTDAVVARNTLHMGGDHPSRVILPVVDQLEF